MRNTTIAILGCWLAAATCTPAQDTYLAKVETVRQSFMDKARAVVSAADEIDLGLQRYDWKSKATDQARLIVTNMFKASAWRDLPSRDTKRYKDAVSALQRYIDEGNYHIQLGRKELAEFKEAEYQAWARAHPEEARALEIQKRLQAAENAAVNAQMQAGAAQSAARRAGQEAEQASQDAQAAKRQAQESDRKAGRAEDSLRQHGIYSW